MFAATLKITARLMSKINVCQQLFRATPKITLGSCLSKVEGLIHEWKHTLLAPPLPLMSHMQFCSTHNDSHAYWILAYISSYMGGVTPDLMSRYSVLHQATYVSNCWSQHHGCLARFSLIRGSAAINANKMCKQLSAGYEATFLTTLEQRAGIAISLCKQFQTFAQPCR